MSNTLARVAQRIAAQSRHPAAFTTFLRQRYEAMTPAAVAEEQHLSNLETLLHSRVEYQELYHAYHKGELTPDETARRMGLRMPNEPREAPKDNTNTPDDK